MCWQAQQVELRLAELQGAEAEIKNAALPQEAGRPVTSQLEVCLAANQMLSPIPAFW